MTDTGLPLRVAGSNFQRLALRANLTLNASEKLEINTDINAAYSDHDRKAANAPYFGRPPGIIYSAMVASPVAKPFDDHPIDRVRTSSAEADDQNPRRADSLCFHVQHPLPPMQPIASVVSDRYVV